VNEIERLETFKTQGLPMKIATDVSKEGPTYLTKRAEQFRTAKELLESGLFRKDSRTGSLSIVIVIEKEEEETEEMEMPAFPNNPKTNKRNIKVKKEKEVKVKKEKDPKVKKEAKETKIKKEVVAPSTPIRALRKRGFSQLSPEAQAVGEDTDELGEDLNKANEHLDESVEDLEVYDFRNRQ
jgi:outer membrane biosynthesis protein TonB